MNQHQRIVDYMSRHKKITPLDAINDLGITKLATQIGELRRSGYEISDQWQEVTNRYGDKCRVKAYSLERTNN